MIQDLNKEISHPGNGSTFTLVILFLILKRFFKYFLFNINYYHVNGVYIQVNSYL